MLTLAPSMHACAAPMPRTSTLPVTRRMLWRQTLGRFRNPESVVRSCEGRVKGVGSKMEEYTNDVQKLQVCGRVMCGLGVWTAERADWRVDQGDGGCHEVWVGVVKSAPSACRSRLAPI